MASSDVSIPLWIIITISVSGLLALITIILYCICWGPKKSSPKFYILDEASGLQTSTLSEFAQNSISNVRLLDSSENKEIKNEAIFTSKNLQYYKMEKNRSELDLLDSLETSHSFGNSALEIDNVYTTREELHSCISSDSHCSFYTTIPALARTSSRGTYLNVDLDSETDTLIN